jgi:signal transduction histidine kinase/CheY-like chemotaxis protein
MLTAYQNKKNEVKEKKELAENAQPWSTLAFGEPALTIHEPHDTAQSQIHEKGIIATVCHELRTSIHGIDGNAHILAGLIADLEQILEVSDQKRVDPKLRELILDKIKLQREALDIIDICAKHQKVITDDVLNMSKIESGMLELNLQPTNPKKIIKQVMDILKGEISKKRLTVYLNIAYQETIVNIDPNRIRQILLNLMTNAIKFTPEGGELTITLLKPYIEEESTILTFSVKDNGIGMDTSEKAHLFMPYSQANAQIVTQYGGSGLGLCISKKLIELMKGRIEVESEKGVGTTFNFSVNCPHKVEMTNKSVSPIILTPLKRTIGQSKKILIVEDNIVNQKIIKNYLTQVGYLCHVAKNGEEGVELWVQNSFQVILMDCEMPVMDGFEATRRIREREKAMPGMESVIIIGLSANTLTEELSVKITGIGMNDYLTKPFDKIKLLETISIHSSKTAIVTEKTSPTSKTA